MYSTEDYFNLLRKLYRKYYSGDLGAQNVYFHNKCCTIGEMEDDAEVSISHNLKRNVKRIKKMIEINDSRDIEDLLLLQEIYYYLTNYNDSLGKYEKLISQRLKHSVSAFENEKRRFDTFKDNQNEFDNLISLIKIIKRFNMMDSRNNIKLELEFNKDDFNPDECIEDLYGQVLNDFNGLRFQI